MGGLSHHKTARVLNRSDFFLRGSHGDDGHFLRTLPENIALPQTNSNFAPENGWQRETTFRLPLWVSFGL